MPEPDVTAELRMINGVFPLRKVLLQFTFVSGLIKVIGFLRSIIIAAYIGANWELDIYNALLVMIGLFVFILGDQYEMLVAQEVAVVYVNDPGRSYRRVSWEYLLLAGGFGVVMTLLLFFTFDSIFPRFVPLLYAMDRTPAKNLMVFFLPLVVFYIPHRTLCALFKAADRFDLAFCIDALQSLLFLGLTFILLSGSVGIHLPSVSSVTLAYSIAFGISFIALFVIWGRILGGFSPVGIDFKQMVSIIRRALSLHGFNYVNYSLTLIDRHFASMVEGGISMLSYASQLSFTLRSIISYEQIYIVEYSRSLDYRASLERSLQTSALVSVPCAAFLVMFANQMVRLIYQRGAFTAEHAARTSEVLIVYGIGTSIFLFWQLIFRMVQVQGQVPRLYPVMVVSAAVDYFSARYLIGVIGLPGTVWGTLIAHILMISGAVSILKAKGLITFSLHFVAQFVGLNAYCFLVAGVVKALLDERMGFLPFAVASLLYFALASIPGFVLLSGEGV